MEVIYWADSNYIIICLVAKLQCMALSYISFVPWFTSKLACYLELVDLCNTNCNVCTLCVVLSLLISIHL